MKRSYADSIGIANDNHTINFPTQRRRRGKQQKNLLGKFNNLDPVDELKPHFAEHTMMAPIREKTVETENQNQTISIPKQNNATNDFLSKFRKGAIMMTDSPVILSSPPKEAISWENAPMRKTSISKSFTSDEKENFDPESHVYSRQDKYHGETDRVPLGVKKEFLSFSWEYGEDDSMDDQFELMGSMRDNMMITPIKANNGGFEVYCD